MYARVHTVETTAEQHQAGVELSLAQLVPWTRDASGFCGLISLFDRAKGVTLVISLWADEEALQASAAAGDRLSTLVAEATGAQRRSLDDYEVSVFEVPRRD